MLNGLMQNIREFCRRQWFERGCENRSVCINQLWALMENDHHPQKNEEKKKTYV